MSVSLPLVARLSENVVRVLGCNPGVMTLQGTNTYLIGKGSRRILLDAGDENKPEYVTLLKNTLKENNLTLQQIVISHWHRDHIGGVGALMKDLKLGCLVSKFPLPEECDTNTKDSEVKFTHLKDGERLYTDGATLRVIHTPGHTKDHIVLYLEEDRTLFSADCILGEGTAVFEDLYDYMASLKKILDVNPSVIYPGHGPVIENPSQKIVSYIAHREEREKQILQALQSCKPEALTALEIVSRVYEGLDPKLKGAAAFNVSHHLHKLHKEKKIVLELDGEDEKFSVV